MRYNDNMNAALKPAIWIDTPQKLQETILRIQDEPRLAVDTESNGLHAYREQVCLIQISTPADDYLIDPLALPDLSSLGVIFANPAIEKVFHAAEYDLICLQRDFGFSFANLFDTMLAARILNYPAVGLNTLLAQKFNIRLNKRYQKADWGKRPLSPEMLHYARMDTHYLLQLRDLLEEELRVSGWLDLAREDFVLACHVTNVRTQPPVWERIKGSQHLSPRQTAILQALVAWREGLAARNNRPTFKVLGNQKLLALANIMPRQKRDLQAAGLSEKQIQRFGAEILEVGAAARHNLPDAPTPWQREDAAFIARVQALKDWRKKEGRRRGAPSDAILPRSLLEHLARENPRTPQDLRQLMAETPWRYEHFGAAILSVLKRHP